MIDFIDDVVSQIIATSLAEWCAVILAIAYVWLAALQNSWCWMCAFLSTAIYTWLFWQVSLPFQSILNVFYMVMAVYGYWQWGRQQENEAPVVSWSLSKHAITVTVLALGSIGLAVLAKGQFSSEYLFVDAAINVFSVATTFMVAHKILQNWLYWFVINLAAAWLYAQSGLMLSACLFIGYVGFSLFGYSQWRRQWSVAHA